MFYEDFEKFILFDTNDQEIHSASDASPTDAITISDDTLNQILITNQKIYGVLFMFFGFWLIYKFKSIIHRLFYNNTKEIK